MPTRYSHVAVALHWTIAAAIVFQIALGWRMEGLKGEAAFALFQLHKSVGITVLLLSMARLIWRLINSPPPLTLQPAWQRIASHAVHALFYVIMIGLPLTGWAIVSSGRIAVPTLLFGVVPWPNLPLGGMSGVHDAAEAGHSLLVWITLGLLALHLGAVAKHQFFDRDTVFSRMMPRAEAGLAEPRFWAVLAAIVGLVIAAKAYEPSRTVLRARPAAPQVEAPIEASSPVVAAPLTEPLASATDPAEIAPVEPVAWAVRPGGRIGFTADWAGSAIEGNFGKWDATIDFSPDALDASRIRATIDLASASTGDSQRDSSLPSADWFDVASHPRAVFEASDFRALGDTRYEARGRLSLRGVTRPLTLSFTLKIVGDTATASGSARIDRTRFGVGHGEWAATDQIGANVAVRFAFTARQK